MSFLKLSLQNCENIIKFEFEHWNEIHTVFFSFFTEKELNALMDELFEEYGGVDLLDDEEDENVKELIMREQELKKSNLSAESDLLEGVSPFETCVHKVVDKHI